MKRHYQNLVVWQRAVALVPEVYRLTRSFPKYETYALSDPMRRAAVSIPANIAEGQGRQHPKEFVQHLAVAKGSLAELHTLLIVSEKLGYLDEPKLREWENQLSEVARPLHGLIEKIANV